MEHSIAEGNKILAGNKIIAEFMGYRFNAYPELRHNNITKPNEEDWYLASWELEDFENHIKNELMYNSSFDWLMPVVEKIRNDHFVSIEMYGDFVAVWITKDKDGPNEGKIYSEHEDAITSIYGAVIQFITWYNQQKGGIKE